jgi:hypothetical protein
MHRYIVVPEIRHTAAGTPITVNVVYREYPYTGQRVEIAPYSGPVSAVLVADALNEARLAEVTPPPAVLPGMDPL